MGINHLLHEIGLSVKREEALVGKIEAGSNPTAGAGLHSLLGFLLG